MSYKIVRIDPLNKTATVQRHTGEKAEVVMGIFGSLDDAIASKCKEVETGIEAVRVAPTTVVNTSKYPMIVTVCATALNVAIFAFMLWRNFG